MMTDNKSSSQGFWWTVESTWMGTWSTRAAIC